MNKQRVLVVEDDPHITLGLREVLESEGFEVITCDKGDAAVALVENKRPTLVLLDVMLPGKSGYDICKEMRARKNNTPVIMLTAKGQELDKVVGLEVGADDYVTKPFGVRELLARIKAVLRRTASAPPANEEGTVIGKARVNFKKLEVTIGKQTSELTAKEAKLLQYLCDHEGEAVSRDALLNSVWGYNYYGTTRTLDQVIVQLRKKIGDDGHNPRHLLTVHGIGYKLQLTNGA